MGPGSIAWLASAPTVAASALDLTIADPRELLARISEEEFQSYLPGAKTRPVVTYSRAGGERARRRGARGVRRRSFHQRNRADRRACATLRRSRRHGRDHSRRVLPSHDPAQIGKVAFHYVRPDFGERLARGETILVAGEGWGSGSSREHAVWALKYAGVKAIVAKSFAFIHKRNLVNEAVPFFTVTDPEFHARAKDGAAISIRANDGVILLDGKEFQSEPVSEIAHMIQSAGGIVPAVEKHGRENVRCIDRGRGRRLNRAPHSPWNPPVSSPGTRSFLPSCRPSNSALLERRSRNPSRLAPRALAAAFSDIFASRVATGARLAMACASSRAVLMSCAAGTTRFTSPTRNAACASRIVPARIISFAIPIPTMRGNLCVPPAPGRIPSPVSGSPIFAFSEATRMSQASAQLEPASQRKSVDHGDRGNRQLFDLAKEQVVSRGEHVFRGAGEQRAHVRAGHEHLVAGTGHDENAACFVSANLLQCLAKFRGRSRDRWRCEHRGGRS
jgi:3-isopropylmalate dehydratase small subunit